MVEFLIENYFFHSLKFNRLLMIVGFISLAIGQYFRIAAEFTAKNNFSHVIMFEKEDNHQLVKHGVYS